MTARRAASDSGDRIWDIVKAAGTDGTTASHILHQAELTRSQFENGKANIRDHKTLEEHECFILWRNLYMVTTNPSLCADAAGVSLHLIDSKLRRLYTGGIQPLGERVGEDPALRYFSRRIGAMLEDLELFASTGFSTASMRARHRDG